MPRSALAFVLAWYTGIYDGGEQDLFPDHSLLVRASAARLIYSASSHKRTNDRPEQEPPTQRMRPSNEVRAHHLVTGDTVNAALVGEHIALLMAPAPPTRCAITHFQTMLLAFQICGAPRLRTRSTWSASWAIPRRFGPRLCSACSKISFTVTLARTACQSAIRSGIMWSALSTDCVQYANMSSCSYIQCP
jgi:hypothetical protein